MIQLVISYLPRVNALTSVIPIMQIYYYLFSLSNKLSTPDQQFFRFFIHSTSPGYGTKKRRCHKEEYDNAAGRKKSV